MSGTSHLNEPLQDESELEKLKAELDAQKDKYLRLQASLIISREGVPKKGLN